MTIGDWAFHELTNLIALIPTAEKVGATGAALLKYHRAVAIWAAAGGLKSTTRQGSRLSGEPQLRGFWLLGDLPVLAVAVLP